MSSTGSQRRGAWKFYLAAVAALAVVPGAYLLWLGPDVSPAAPVATNEEAPATPRELKVARTEGTVELRRGTAEWKVVQVGEVLGEADALRTGEGAEAVLSGGALLEVTLEQSTELSISALNQTLSRFELEEGVASARVRGDGLHQFEVRASGGGVVARTRKGEFTMGANRAGTVAVGTQSGEVELSGKGKVVIVRAGQQSIVQKGESPSEPVALPKSLLLRVQLPARSTVRTPRHVLAGRVEPGARVEVNGKLVEPDAAGTFAHPLLLREGTNRIQVRGWSVGGLHSASEHQLELDTTVKRVVIDRTLWDDPPPSPSRAP